VEQQQRHLAQYRAVPNDLQWAHFAWLSRQYVALFFLSVPVAAACLLIRARADTR